SWTGSAVAFNALSFTAGEQGTFTLSISANTTGDEAATSTATYTLTVNAVAEGPVLGGTSSLTVDEGGAVTFGATDSKLDGDDSLGTVTITGLPHDLTNVNGGSYDSTTGSWTGSAVAFNALSFTAGEQGTFTLSISANTTGDEAATSTATYTLTVNAVAEGPVLGGTSSLTVDEGGAVTFGATDSKLDGDDSLGTVTITGLPHDLTNVNGGSYDSTTGSWTGSAVAFNALSFTAGEQGTFTLSISANTTGDEAATSTATYTLTVNAVAEGPVLGGTSSLTVDEGGAVTFGATDSKLDGDDSLGTVTITGLPHDLTNVNGGSYDSTTGSWTGSAVAFNALSFTAGEQGTFTLSISANTTGGEAATSTATYTLTVNAGAEGPVLGGTRSLPVDEGGAVPFGATDSKLDGDDSLGTVTITGLPHDLTNV